MNFNYIRRTPEIFNFFNSAKKSQPSHFPYPFYVDDLELEAIVDQTISPTCPGRVQWRSTTWHARCMHPVTLLPGQVCRVVDMHSITLIVEPITQKF
ncbi:NfeD family protein [Roseofilum sp. Guam]|uniref:NfeD family protein n=1 Tax=Roseofilum sp. Guam TaxID=2821502 RepID=UPI001B050186|nr:NfeD family protein [Roseofilum sp. Guam]